MMVMLTLKQVQPNTLALQLNFSAQGNGSYSSSGGIYHWGGNPLDNDFASHKPELGVFQLGVGTRNIKEAIKGWTSRTEDGTSPIGDWSNIASYTVKTLGSKRQQTGRANINLSHKPRFRKTTSILGSR